MPYFRHFGAIATIRVRWSWRRNWCFHAISVTALFHGKPHCGRNVDWHRDICLGGDHSLNARKIRLYEDFRFEQNHYFTAVFWLQILTPFCGNLSDILQKKSCSLVLFLKNHTPISAPISTKCKLQNHYKCIDFAIITCYTYGNNNKHNKLV